MKSIFGGISLSIRCLEGCGDLSLTTDYNPTATGEYEWNEEVIPVLFDLMIDHQNNNGASLQLLKTAPSYSSISIGRRPSCTIRLKDPSISGYHCRLVVARAPRIKRSLSEERRSDNEPINEGKQLSENITQSVSNVYCYLIDSSTNGTFIDNIKIDRDVPILISSNQIISLGRGKIDEKNDGETIHTFAFTHALMPFSRYQGERRRVVELEESSVSARQDESPILGSVDGSVDVGMAPATSRIVPLTATTTETQCPRSSSTSHRYNQSSSIYPPTSILQSPLLPASYHNPMFMDRQINSQNSSAMIDGPQLSKLLRGSSKHSLESSGILCPPDSQIFFQSPSPNPRKSTPPPSTRRISRPPSVRLGCGTATRNVPGLCPSADSQVEVGGIGIRATSSTSTTGGRLADLVKRLQDESMKKGEEIAEMAGELERSESLREQILRELNDVRVELDEVRKSLGQSELKGQSLRQQTEQLNHKNDILERSLRDMERWRRHAEDSETQISVLMKRLEGTSTQLKEVQSTRDLLVQQLHQKTEQVEELEIRSQQTSVLLDSSRAEVDRIRQELEAAVTDQRSKLLKAEENLQVSYNESRRGKSRIRELELEIEGWTQQKGEWEVQQREWKEKETELETRLNETQQELRNNEKEIRCQRELILRMQGTFGRMATYLTAALDLSIGFGKHETNGFEGQEPGGTPQTTQLFNGIQLQEGECEQEPNKLFESEALLSMPLPTQSDELKHPSTAQMTVDQNFISALPPVTQQCRRNGTHLRYSHARTNAISCSNNNSSNESMSESKTDGDVTDEDELFDDGHDDMTNNVEKTQQKLHHIVDQSLEKPQLSLASSSQVMNTQQQKRHHQEDGDTARDCRLLKRRRLSSHSQPGMFQQRESQNLQNNKNTSVDPNHHNEGLMECDPVNDCINDKTPDSISVDATPRIIQAHIENSMKKEDQPDGGWITLRRRRSKESQLQQRGESTDGNNEDLNKELNLLCTSSGNEQKMHFLELPSTEINGPKIQPANTESSDQCLILNRNQNEQDQQKNGTCRTECGSSNFELSVDRLLNSGSIAPTDAFDAGGAG